MKQRPSVGRKSLFWSRLLGLLIAFAIVAVLVTGGVKNLTGELSAAYEALAASQYELGAAQHALATTADELASVKSENLLYQSELAKAQDVLDSRARALMHARRQFEEAGRLIGALSVENETMKRNLSQSQSDAVARSREIVALKEELRQTEAALEQQLSLPQYSMIVTTERVMEASYYERFAASQVTMYAESDAGMLFYDGQEALHEIEEYVSYAERTQVVLTTTAPGQDVLECLNEANRRRRGRRGCGQIVPVQASAMRMEAYSYQMQYSSMESLLWME